MNEVKWTRRPVKHRRQRGLSLIEVLVCVGISAMLLTSMAVAFQSAFLSYHDAQERSQLQNNGRNFMQMLRTDIQMSDAHGPWDPSSSVMSQEVNQFNAYAGPAVTPGYPNSGLPTSSPAGSGVIGIQMIKTHADSMDAGASKSSPVTITYWYDQPNKQVLMTRKQAGVTSPQSPVCLGVQGFQVYMQPVYVPFDPTTGATPTFALQRALVVLTLANIDAAGNKIFADAGQKLTVQMVDAAVPRRNTDAL